MSRSGLQRMWMYVMFDLPVVEKEERRMATKFRNHLLDGGFIMEQFSAYYKLIGGKEEIPKYAKRVEKTLPPKGKVDILSITDNQYGNIITYRARKTQKGPKKAVQYLLF